MPNHPQREDIIGRIQQAAQGLDGSAAFASFVSAVLAQCRTTSFSERGAAESAAQLVALYGTAQAEGGSLKVQVTATDRGVRVCTVMADQPFIIDTIRKALRGAGAGRVSGFHVVLPGEPATSCSCFEADNLSDTDAISADLTARLGLSAAVVQDFGAMKEAVAASADAAAAAGDAEGAAFLRWSLDDNFVFLSVSRSAEGAAPIHLGADTVGSALWPAPTLLSGPTGSADKVVNVRKDSTESPIHRNGRIDSVRVSTPAGCWVLRGMFTRRALTQPCRNLPILRRVLEEVLAGSNARPTSYRYRGLSNSFDSLPTEWLFSASLDQVRDVLDRVFDAEQDQTAQLHLTQEDGTTFALIALPERRYSDALRGRILGWLSALTNASYTDSGLFAGRFETVLLQVYQTGTRTLSAAEIQSLRAFVVELATPFSERLAPALVEHFGEDAVDVAGRYADAFPPEYVDDTLATLAALDVRLLTRARTGQRTIAQLHDDGTDLLLRVYQSRDLLLTELMPIIDNFGLIISSQSAIQVDALGQPAQQIDIFRIQGVSGLSREKIVERAALLVAGLEAVFDKHIASDAYNRLVLTAGLSWEQVDLVRGCFGYARQLTLRHTIARIQEILLKQAGVVAAIVRWYDARFNPDLDGDRAAIADAANGEALELLKQIKTADEDTVLRTLHNLVESMLRTNFYRTDRVCHYISFKVDHAKVKQMPQPRMWREIYVHHREVEGVHLRGGPIARGGIRFSDRADFRTEILGLVATQMVKNVVIVPEGSKGGFYIKHTITDPAEYRRKGDELYQILMRGLLDVTDNYVAAADKMGVVRPPRVVAHDPDDPYLVVAADKGTAHLSDTANRISLSYGFWLGDAFASGGSNGYDHKVVGITARGGWVLVRRHFREMGIDPDKDAFTCIGIGDCGGDVFGNGVIETSRMKLMAAFNHAHIFFDPDPDMDTSFEERKRLFNEVKGWGHYNQSLLSKGGGIFDRKTRSIPLSPEVKAMLGTLADELSPEQVMNLILKMRVDLLWNGGIGTYVRASNETNADANDPPNDDLRVSAPELRCKVVGEGGNLGFTQAARVEYALSGGRLNTDFVDNSGGVDTSDHEVNLKILLNPMVASGRITLQDRNDFLRSLTEDVVQAVLADCNANGRLISLDVARSAQDPLSFARAMDWIQSKGSPDRRRLVLPSDEELKRRAAARQGLTRPELAVLQAHLKMHLFKMLMADDPALIPGFADLVQGYFPPAVQARFGADLPGHMLMKAIGMTVLLTEVMTDAGCNFFPHLMDLSGASAGRVAGAWRRAMILTGADDLKRRLVAAQPRPEAAHRAWNAFVDGVQLLVAGWLAPGASGEEDSTRFHAALDAVAASRPRADQAATRASVDSLVEKGIPAALAAAIINRAFAVMASEVAKVAAARNEDIALAAVRYQAVGTASRLLSTMRAVSTRKGGGRWDPVAMGILTLRYQTLLRDLVINDTTPVEVLQLGTDRAAETLAASGTLQAVASVVDRILGDSPDVAALLVAEQQIRASV